MSTIELQLQQGLQPLGLTRLVEPLTNYLMLLHKWNGAYNLTAVRDVETMIYKHLLDSLAIAPWFQGPRVLDVGTGAGLPGIPLALAFPDIHWVLLDSNGKKTRFLKEVKRQLQLNQIEIVDQRVELYQPGPVFDTVVSRAFSSLEQMIHWTNHLLAPDGFWLAMKGTHPNEELANINQPYQVISYTVEGIEGERCCVLIKRTNKE